MIKVLIIKISSMGDIIHTLPAVTDAANIIPNILFDWIVEHTFSEIPKWHPAIHKIIPITLKKWIKKWYLPSSWSEYQKNLNQLKHKKYDIVIDAQGLLKTSIFITSNTKGCKHGMNYRSIRETIGCYCYDIHHQIHKNQHAIQRIRQLFSQSLKYSLPNSVGEYNIQHLFNKPKEQSEKYKKNNTPYLIFLHATTRPEKHWAYDNWYKILIYAIKDGYHIKLPFWTKNEEKNVYFLAQSRHNQITILPKLTLQQIAEQISKATAIISIDTGLSHLAAALNRPNLVLYGPTDPKLIGVYGKNQNILKSSTNYMKHITASAVWNAFHNMLKT